MKEHIQKAFKENLAAISEAQNQVENLLAIAQKMAEAFSVGQTVYICGNGGSASQAQHFAAEFVGRFLIERPALPAVALTCDTSILTAIGNDYGFEKVFERQVCALVKPGDIVWGLSTSGRSQNVLLALKAAKEAGGQTFLMCGPNVPLEVELDMVLSTPQISTPRIQELHLFYGHTLCQMVDHILFEKPCEGQM